MALNIPTDIALHHSFNVTPSDTVRFPKSVIRCGGAGNLSYVDPTGEIINYGAVAAGEKVLAQAIGVMATNTTATPITRHCN